MSISWGTVQTAAATALLVTLVVEYTVKPQLEARKDRHLEALRTRRQFLALMLDLSWSTDLYVTDDSSVDKDPTLRSRLQAERHRTYERVESQVRELFDHTGRFAAAYPAGYLQRDLVSLSTTAYGVMLSTRSRHRQAEIVKELATFAHRIYGQGIFKVLDIARAREELRARVEELQELPPPDGTVTR